MSYMDQIDPNRQMMIYGSVTRDLSKMTQDPHHALAMDMAQASLNPAFLRMADPIEDSQPPRSGSAVSGLANWRVGLGR